MNENDPTMAADDDMRAEEPDCEPDAPEAEDGEPETFVLELDGQAHTLPAALKGAFLRQADYTRKTQELAHHRRALEAERAAVAEQARTAAGATSERAHLAALDHQLGAFGDIDWQGLAQADPQRAQALWDRFQQTQALRDHSAQALAHHEAHERLRAEREAAEAMAETGRVLARDIPGWSPELAAKLADYAIGQGITPEELRAAADPRIWKVLHKAFHAEAGARGEPSAKAQAMRPAVSIAGAAASGGGVRDDLATQDWMRRRNEQVRKSR